jgi:hypothetical protein
MPHLSFMHKEWIASGLLLFSTATFAADSSAPRFRQVEIDRQIQIGYGLAIADVDGDKKKDILLVDKRQIVWYRNPSWEKFVIAENLTPEDNVCIAAADIDGDGKAEIAVGAGWNPGDTVNSGAVFYLLPPSDRTKRWEPIQLHHEPTVHRMRWVKNAAGKFDLVVVPLHGRGNKDGAGEGVKILAYHMPADPREEWKTSMINDALHKTHNFQPVSWNTQPGDEMLLGSREGVFLVAQSENGWRAVPMTGTESDGAGEVRIGNLSKANQFLATVEPMHGTNLVVYTAPKKSPLWARHVLDNSLVDGHALACGDFNGSGRDQVVVGWRAMNKPGVNVGIKLFTATDDTLESWTESLIDNNTMACEDLVVADLNADGKLDIVAAGRGTKNVKIYFNEGAAK